MAPQRRVFSNRYKYQSCLWYTPLCSCVLFFVIVLPSTSFSDMRMMASEITTFAETQVNGYNHGAITLRELNQDMTNVAYLTAMILQIQVLTMVIT